MCGVGKDGSRRQKERKHPQEQPLSGVQGIWTFIGDSKAAAGACGLSAPSAAVRASLFRLARHLSRTGNFKRYFLLRGDVLGDIEVHGLVLWVGCVLIGGTVTCRELH